MHAALWKGTTGAIDITGAVTNPGSIEPAALDGVSNNSPFTLEGDLTGDSHYFEIALSDISTATDITFTPAASNNRFIVWGIQIIGAATALENVAPAELDLNAPMYNVVGQRVDASYQGIVIQNGQKYLIVR